MRPKPSLFRSFGHAFEGLFFALKHNRNLRIHFAMGTLVAIASVYFDVNPFEMGILGVMIILVITCEMLNTAIEEITNLVTKEHHQEAKIAKDVAAGMVLLSAWGAIIVGILIFVPHLTKLFR